jgi:hypothetical protein
MNVHFAILSLLTNRPSWFPAVRLPDTGNEELDRAVLASESAGLQ